MDRQFVVDFYIGLDKDGGYCVEITNHEAGIKWIKFFKNGEFQKVLKYISDKEDELNPCESE